MSIMIVVVILSVVYKNYVSTTNISLETQQENIVDKMDTSFQIVNGTYDSTNGLILIYMKNTGSLKMDPNQIDIYSDTGRLERDSTNKEINIVENMVNSNHWDPGELVLVNISRTLSSGPHLFRIGVENGITRSVIIEA